MQPAYIDGSLSTTTLYGSSAPSTAYTYGVRVYEKLECKKYVFTPHLDANRKYEY